MYIEMTNECQMRCRHCAVNSKRVGHGRYISTADAIKALDLRSKNPLLKSVAFSGAESTLHPDFLRILRHAIRLGFGIGVVTNGVNEKIALILAHWARRPIGMRVWLSDDQYHDSAMVSKRVVETYTRLAKLPLKRGAYGVAITGQRHVLTRMGRAVRLKNVQYNNDRCCQGNIAAWYVRTNGMVAVCSCPKSRTIGHIQQIEDFPPTGFGHEINDQENNR